MEEGRGHWMAWDPNHQLTVEDELEADAENNLEESDDVLNALGSEGWELVSVVSKSLNYVEQSSGIPNPLDFLSPDSKTVNKKDLKAIKAFFKKEVTR